MEGWDEYLENTNQVVSDALSTVQANTDAVYRTLLSMGEEYSLSISESLTSPWTKGEFAVQSFSEKFGLTMSATVTELQKLETEFNATMSRIEQNAIKAANRVQQSMSSYTSAEYQAPKEEPKQETPKEEPKQEATPSIPSVGETVVVKAGTTRWGAREKNAKMSSWVPGASGITVAKVSGDQAQLKRKGEIIGWANISDLEGYAKGTTGVKKDQLAWIDELGEELVMRPQNGRLTFMTKGTSVIPASQTENLMKWGELDPSDMLERNRPQIAMSPSVVNNTMEFSIDASVGELIHVEQLNGNNPAEIAKIVDKAWDKHMKELNAHIRRYASK